MGIAVAAFHAWNDYLGLTGIVPPNMKQEMRDNYERHGLHIIDFGGDDRYDLNIG